MGIVVSEKLPEPWHNRLSRRRVRQRQSDTESGNKLKLGNDPLLPTVTLKAIKKKAARWPLPQREERAARAKWEGLVTLACESGAFGWILIDGGGLPALAALLRTRTPALSLALDRWEKAGLIRRYYGRRVKRQPPVVAIEIVVLAEIIEWLEDARAHLLAGYPQAPTRKQIWKLLHLSLDLALPPPPEAAATKTEASSAISAFAASGS